MFRYFRHMRKAVRWGKFLAPIIYGMLLIISLGLNAQTPFEKKMLDSLAYIADTSVGEAKVDALLLLEKTSQVYSGTSFGYLPISICNEALTISKEIGYLEGELLANHRLAYRHNGIGRFSSALGYAKRYVSLASGYPDSVADLHYMSIYPLLCISYRGLEMYDSAHFYITRSLELAEQTGDCKAVSNRLLDLGNLYSSMGDHQGELQAFLDAYYGLKNCPDTNQRSNRAIFARLLGYSFMTLGNYKEALKYFRDADSIYGSMHLYNLRIKAYHARQASNIARVYQHWGKLDSALLYRNLALKRFFGYGFKETNIDIPNQYCYIGKIYREQGDYFSAMEYLEKSFTLRKRNGDSLGVGMCLDELAIMAKLRGNYHYAVQLLQESLHWKMNFLDGKIDPQRNTQWVESHAETYLVLGQVFADWKKYADALMYYDTANILYTQLGYSRGEAQVEYFRGLAWQANGYPDTARKHFEKSLELAIQLNNRPLIAQANEGLGKIYCATGNMWDGLEKYDEAIAIYQEDGFITKLPEIYLARGEIYYWLGSIVEATNDLMQAHQLALKMGMIKIQADAAYIIAEIHKHGGDHLSAFQYLKEYTTLHDSIFTLETHKQLAEMQAFHESQQHELEIARLEQDNEISSLRVNQSRYVIISLGGLLIIILLFALLYLRQIQIRNEQRTLLNQQKLFRSQMNPHFLFNSLTNIQHYIFNKDSLSAGKYLAVFAKLMRSILNNSRKEIITLRDEIDTIRQYLELQQLRMEDKLDYTVDVDESLDQETTEIPPMLAQPFIENAIEHGIRSREGGGLVSVRILRNDHCLIYEIEDDGVGRKKHAEILENKKKDHESMAVSLTRSRLTTLWGRRKPEKIFEFIDLTDGDGNACGTLVRFKVPL